MKMTEQWLYTASADFWERCGLDETRVPYPRDLTDPTLYGKVPLDIEPVENLHLDHVAQIATRYDLSIEIGGANRRLRACILAWNGIGFILVDAKDPADEQRFSLAHEIAHFLLEYDAPRRACIERLGVAVLPALDGLRRPTPDERAHALLAAVKIGTHTHLMEREAGGVVADTAVAVAEQRADALALELLAPAADAWEAITRDPEWRTLYHDARHKRAERVLWEAFGLPRPIARRYAADLLARYQPARSVREWLNI